MPQFSQQVSELEKSLKEALDLIGFDKLMQEKKEIDAVVNKDDFWQNQELARASLKRQTQLNDKLTVWIKLKKEIEELKELNELDDQSLEDELIKQLHKINSRFNEAREQLRFNGPYDDHDVILSIYAGAGGVDAQDWARMLLRMYLRWSERKKFKTSVIEESLNESGGIKSTTIEIEGANAYGLLKNESGVHRLVRLSPFNADNLRQTSFARIEVLPKIDRPEEINIDEKDVRVDVFRSGGHGGQSVNTTDSAVRLTHIPTGLTVSIQNERSQLQNKETAFTVLRSKLAQLQLDQHQEKIDQLRGPNTAAEWGNQIRSYVLHPYKQVKDLRSGYESSDPDKILDGEIDDLIQALTNSSRINVENS